MKLSNNNYIRNLNLTDNWISTLIHTVEHSNRQGKNVIVIAIARKMARLFEYYTIRDERINRIFEDSNDFHNILITEHAIPFCLSSLDASKNDIIILDDLIVYGDTVVTVSEIVFYMTGIKPKVIAMAASNEASKTYAYADLIYPVTEDSDIITIKEFPAYTAKNSWKIISLNKSIDLEHTILHIKGSFGNWMEKSNLIETTLNQHFPDATVYMVSHRIPGGGNTLSASIVFPNEYKGKINDDFSKIRIYFGPEDILFTCYTPNYWDENILKNNATLFNTAGSNNIWKQIREKLGNLASDKNLSVSTLDNNRMESYYNLRIEQTAVVVANYLISFDSAMFFLPKLRLSMKEILDSDYEFSMSKLDLDWIFGPQLAADVYKSLQNNLNSELTVHNAINYSNSYYTEISNKNLPLIPEDKLQEYILRKRIDAYLSLNIPMALSLTFLRLWKNFGISKKSREDRIRVGETYDSLFSTISLFFKHTAVNKNIHSWMDRSIDLGAVVPKYEYFHNRLGLRIWRRFFRAGERESAMTDVAKVVMSIISHLHADINQISYSEFKKDVFPVLEDLAEKFPGQLNLELFREDINFSVNKFDVSYVIWIYFVLSSGLKLKDDDSWSIVLLEGKDNLKPEAVLFLPD